MFPECSGFKTDFEDLEGITLGKLLEFLVTRVPWNEPSLRIVLPLADRIIISKNKDNLPGLQLEFW